MGFRVPSQCNWGVIFNEESPYQSLSVKIPLLFQYVKNQVHDIEFNYELYLALLLDSVCRPAGKFKP